MQAPMLVVNATQKRETGRKAQLANVQAAKVVADVIRTTLGPQSMLKMILDPMGGVVLTNDGNAILREIDVSHPAAKSMIELSRTQDEEVGDGTTSVIILAGQLLKEAEPFLVRNMHPRVIVGAYVKALDEALEVLDSLAVKLDTSDRDQVLALVRSTLGTKFVSRFGDLVSNLAMQAVTTVMVKNGDRTVIDTKRYARVEKVPGGELSDCCVLDGIVINKDITHARMRRRIENPRIILLDCPLEFKKGESQTNIEITNDTDWETILKMEEEYIEKLCNDIIALKPDLVMTEKGVSDLAQHYFVKAGITCLRRLRKTDNNRIARAVGATIVHEPSELKESDVGTKCGLFDVRKIGDEYFTYLVDCKEPKACSIVLRGASKDVLNEIERNLHDAMGALSNLMQDPRVVPGGGATEMAIGAALRAKSKQIEGVQQWPYRAVAKALEVIPRTLIENCGGSIIRLLTELRAKHASGEDGCSNFGIDGHKGKVVNMTDIKIWEQVTVKQQTIKTAIEAAAMLLRIDDVQSGISRKQ
eukprot:TRINITY_DN29608_c0_g1_i1.p1 TRINITY_DN29608_c0_g1~~TRINITY_DN29608_c0_g1_i1.p1  ORF type:complete len:544 (-),score=314.76 TRINITY_DN29608_c0_g1_i1:278-1870(-)